MAAPDVRIYLKTEASNDTHSTTPTDYMILTGGESSVMWSGAVISGTTYGVAQQILPNEGELPIPCEALFVTTDQVRTHISTYTYGNITACNYDSDDYMFSVRFYNNACSRAPELHAFDNPVTRTTKNRIFSGSQTSTFMSLIRAIDITNTTVVGYADNTYTGDYRWWLYSAENSTNRNVALRGDDHYLVAAEASSWNAADAEWNIHITVLAPTDFSATPTDIGFYLAVYYYYS